MDEQTRVNQIQVRQQRKWIQPPMPQENAFQTSAELIDLPVREKGLKRLFQPENLSRNLALVGCLALVVLALQQTGSEKSVSVFSTLRDEMTATWDQDVGKLSFVSDLLPAEIQAVWNPAAGIAVQTPVNGQVVHTWSVQEPYLEMSTTVTDVRSAGDGEVMSIAHGLDEERIIRIRHTDGSEALYGNLQSAHVEVGSVVESGEIIASLLPDKPLAFELRVNGQSVDPVPCMSDWTE
ncbi:MAG: M23 family metallopeptidase [Clostridia bacterium]|nr:M23 family metallopeptidase [Clostridia bacterium]